MWKARIFLMCKFWIEVFLEVFSNLLLFIFSFHFHNIWSCLFIFLLTIEDVYTHSRQKRHRKIERTR